MAGSESRPPSQSFKINHLAVPATERLPEINTGTRTPTRFLQWMEKWNAHPARHGSGLAELLDTRLEVNFQFFDSGFWEIRNLPAAD
jgi:hypothetical protein